MVLRNRFDRAELAGAFGDLGTLIPFVVAYINLLGMDPCGVLLAFASPCWRPASITRLHFLFSR
jgi:hypothetical protein